MDTQKQGATQIKVLVIVEVGQTVNVYSDCPGVEVKLLQSPSIEGKDAEIALERFIEVSLPTYWSRIYREGKRIALFTAKPLTLIDAARNQLAIAFCRAVDVDANEANRGAA